MNDMNVHDTSFDTEIELGNGFSIKELEARLEMGGDCCGGAFSPGSPLGPGPLLSCLIA
jgi:hypothetical protein